MLKYLHSTFSNDYQNTIVTIIIVILCITIKLVIIFIMTLLTDGS